ncbi:hypothetical protein DFH05DRAFT_1463566 [Lentinula detonsa]|uniref:DH domain-containing protein n=1 Tax=Lentinula detonsa TaxID=2804962 RepID=A0A9W8NS26_9AGAR|nr:hypothetical protein DFH05DRAFT_1463566 [Lentinula detonsa]
MAQSFTSRSRAEGDKLNLPIVGERSTTLTLYPVSFPQSKFSLFRPEDDRPGQADDVVKVQDKDDQVAVDRLDAAQRNSSQSSSSAQADRSSSSDTSTHTIKVRDDPDTHETEPPETSFPHTQTLPTCDSMAFSSSRAVHYYTDIDVDEKPDVDGPNLVDGFEHTDTEILEDDAGIYHAGSQSSLISVPSQLIRDAMDEILPKLYDVVGVNEDEEAGIERRGSSFELTDAKADGNRGSNEVFVLSSQSSYASTTSSSSSDTLAPPSSPTHPDAIPEDVPHPQPTDASTPIPQPCPGPTSSVVWREYDIARQLPVSRNPCGLNQKFQNSHTSWIPRFLCNQESEDGSEGVDSRREDVQAGHFLTDSSLADESIDSPDSSASTYVEPSPLRRHSLLSPTSSMENRDIVNGHEEGTETRIVETLGSSTGIPISLDMEAPLAPMGTDTDTDEMTTTTVSIVSISSNSTLKQKRTIENRTRANGQNQPTAYPSSSLPYGSSSTSSSTSIYTDPLSSLSSSPEASSSSSVMPTVAVNPSSPPVNTSLMSSSSNNATASNSNSNSSPSSSAVRLDLKHYLTRPSEHLQKYPVLLSAILKETAEGNPDAEFLHEAIEALGNLQTVAQLRTFQKAMGRGLPGKWEWHDLVSKETRESLERKECKRQSIIFELIKGEMAYAKDLENIDIMYIRPLREADPPIITRDRLDSFITDVFHNFAELHAHHQRLVEKFHEVQTEEFPAIRSVIAAVFDAALNFREAYMEYIPNYPIAAYRIDDEMANNPAFKTFVELLLKGILDETPEGHEDRVEIPQVLEVIKAVGKDTEPGVVSAKQKTELWRYNSNVVFKPGEWVDMNLLDKNCSLIHTGSLLRQPMAGWNEMGGANFVMTKAREKDGITKYFVNRRPIPLDLLTLVNFTDPPTQRGAGLLRNLRGGERHNTADTSSPSPLTSSNSTGASGLSSSTSTSGAGTSANTPADTSHTDARSVYPCTIHHNGRMGGNYILYAESASARSEWKEKLEEAVGLRKVVQESNKVFEIETLCSDTFLVPSMGLGGNERGDRGAAGGGLGPSYENAFTGKVTCSVPFNTPDGRGLVAIGIYSTAMRRVLHLKMVTQCAMLEDFGIFLVLADKSLFAYHIEALVPSSPSSSHSSQTPQKLSGNKDVYFFSVGTLHGRTLVIYMKKKGLDSIFHVVEPVVEGINERAKAPQGLMDKPSQIGSELIGSSSYPQNHRGRGASDTKAGLAGIMLTLEALIEKGWTSKRTVVLAFGFDEEASGTYRIDYLASTVTELEKNPFAVELAHDTVPHDTLLCARLKICLCRKIVGILVSSVLLRQRIWCRAHNRINTLSSVNETAAHDTQTITGIARAFNLTLRAFGEEDVIPASTYLLSEPKGQIELSQAFNHELEPTPWTPTSGKDSGPWDFLSGTIKATYDTHRSFRGTDGEESKNKSVIVASPGMSTGNTSTLVHFCLLMATFTDWRGC